MLALKSSLTPTRKTCPALKAPAVEIEIVTVRVGLEPTLMFASSPSVVPVLRRVKVPVAPTSGDEFPLKSAEASVKMRLVLTTGIGVALGVALGVAWGVAFGVATGVAIGVAVSVGAGFGVKLLPPLQPGSKKAKGKATNKMPLTADGAKVWNRDFIKWFLISVTEDSRKSP